MCSGIFGTVFLHPLMLAGPGASCPDMLGGQKGLPQTATTTGTRPVPAIFGMKKDEKGVIDFLALHVRRFPRPYWGSLEALLTPFS